MDVSRVTQSIEFLWFYTNILTCRHENQFTPLIHAKELPKRDSEKPNSPFLLNQQNHESEVNAEDMIPRCSKCGEISSVFEEERVMSNNSEMLKDGRETEKRERRKRKNKNKNRSAAGLKGMEVILGGLDLGFDVKENAWFTESCVNQMLAVQQQSKMPPIDDDTAMKEHLKSWAYAVACTVK